jgi:3-isopropylmalate/(R)-2-methylmalate dehydratase large subunit
MSAGMTMAEQVLARASGRDHVAPGDYLTAQIDVAMCHEAFTWCARQLLDLGIGELWDPDRVIVILDHSFPPATERMALGHVAARRFVEQFGVGTFLGHAGICHQVLVERGLVRPGQLVLGTDSHSCTYGAVGAAGAGIGLTEMTYVLATGELWMRVPETIRFVLGGTPVPGTMSKDVVLFLAGRYGTDVAQYGSIEYTGSLAERMSIASRLTMANMGVELGAKFAFFAADDRTSDFYETACGTRVESFGPDLDAVCARVLSEDLDGLGPQVALPSNPGNVRPIEEVERVRIDQAFLGSCTNARLEDLAVAAGILAGHHVHPRTRLIVTPASQQVALDATRAGYVETLLAAGAFMTAPGCGACPGGHSGVLGPGEVCVSSTNRNFPGRMGSAQAQVYLASPATVAASAIAGHLTDPRELWSVEAASAVTW